MEYRRLGTTGLWVSAVSLGGHWKKLPFEFRTDEFKKNRREVVSACIEHGINYVDACTDGEVEAYTDALRGRREEMFLGCSHCDHEMRNKEWQTAPKLLEALDKGRQGPLYRHLHAQARLGHSDDANISGAHTGRCCAIHGRVEKGARAC
jgi:aryl-alcohol dehydrogenase-like predicted oxidoreductase